MTAPRVVRVAGGQGFWGDWLEAPRRQVEGGPVDYLMLDYLAEVTMSILQKQKERDPSLGYARDFVGAVESVLPRGDRSRGPRRRQRRRRQPAGLRGSGAGAWRESGGADQACASAS